MNVIFYYARAQQIWENFRASSTGQLSLISSLLLLVGNMGKPQLKPPKEALFSRTQYNSNSLAARAQRTRDIGVSPDAAEG
jgi:hypothetical protein